jgi:predicted proteasome-type protease
VMLHLLLAELPTPPTEQEALTQLDNMLRTKLISNDFIWDSELSVGFPREVYWYLYGKLKS